MEKSITLKNLLIKQQKCIGLLFNADKVIDALVKQLPDPKWSNEFKMPYVLNTQLNQNLIFDKFRGVAWINCNYFFHDRVLNHDN